VADHLTTGDLSFDNPENTIKAETGILEPPETLPAKDLPEIPGQTAPPELLGVEVECPVKKTNGLSCVVEMIRDAAPGVRLPGIS
jgi:hypothetical protein